RPGELDLPNLHYAAGLGLRYLTPVGAIRFDYGFRLNRRSEAPWTCSGTFDCAAFHFTLGQAF
ncbi:MAG: BamA/TamA family outer membrane protein, partial [Myxococcota bacterium]